CTKMKVFSKRHKAMMMQKLSDRYVTSRVKKVFKKFNFYKGYLNMCYNLQVTLFINYKVLHA
ncbi:MAG TPA: hypothetical protein VNS50_01660, partial [Ginsengibacter sp.]|nr:hypothetical protein [Ginsengibacter sp.]